MGVHQKQLGFTAAIGRKSRFHFTPDHDRAIIAAAVNGQSARGVLAVIGCSVSQLDARREALKRYGFLIPRAGGGFAAGEGIVIDAQPRQVIRASSVANPRGAAGNYAAPVKADTFVERHDRKAPAPVRDQDGALLTMATVGSRQCRWPFGRPATDTFHLCGHDTADGAPYCAYHTARARGGAVGQGEE